MSKVRVLSLLADNKLRTYYMISRAQLLASNAHRALAFKRLDLYNMQRILLYTCTLYRIICDHVRKHALGECWVMRSQTNETGLV